MLQQSWEGSFAPRIVVAVVVALVGMFALPGTAMASWVQVTSGTTLDLNGITGVGDERVIVGGENDEYVILRRDGAGWDLEEEGTGFELRGASGVDRNDMFAVGGGLDGPDFFDVPVVMFYNGNDWQQDVAPRGPRIVPVPFSDTLYGVYALGSGSAVAVGGRGGDILSGGPDGFIYSLTYLNYVSELLPADAIVHDVHGTSPQNVFAVGYYDSGFGSTAYVYENDGTGWTTTTSVDGIRLYGVYALAADDAFAVGTNGTILRFDGTSWAAMSSGTTNTLRAVWASSANHAIAVGDNGTILKFDGTAWSPMSSGTTARLNDVFGGSETDVQIVGDDGTILELGDGPVLVRSFVLYFDWERKGTYSSTIVDLYSDHQFYDEYADGIASGIWEIRRIQPLPGEWKLPVPAISLKYADGCKPLYAGTFFGYMSCTDGSMQDALPGYWYVQDPQDPAEPRAAATSGGNASPSSPRATER